jgi:hypothetical protein
MGILSQLGVRHLSIRFRNPNHKQNLHAFFIVTIQRHARPNRPGRQAHDLVFGLRGLDLVATTQRNNAACSLLIPTGQRLNQDGAFLFSVGKFWLATPLLLPILNEFGADIMYQDDLSPFLRQLLACLSQEDTDSAVVSCAAGVRIEIIPCRWSTEEPDPARVERIT